MPRLNRDRTAEGNKRPTKRSTSENGDFDLEKVKSMQKGKKSLRIDRNTVILVDKSKCTPEYARKYKERIDKNK